MPFPIFPLSLVLFSLLEWYIIPLSDFNSSLYFPIIIRQSSFNLYLQVHFISCFSPQNPWCKLFIGVLHCFPNSAAKKTLQWFPSLQNTCVIILYTFLLIQWILFFPSHWLTTNNRYPHMLVLNPLPSCICLLSLQFLRPELPPSLLHPMSSSSSLALGSSPLSYCSWPACAVREEWGSM